MAMYTIGRAVMDETSAGSAKTGYDVDEARDELKLVVGYTIELALRSVAWLARKAARLNEQ
uniref:Uncharacterized protein n=1 Tax=Oryza brachyantha TaxID=4533 RepID=J3NCA1_ORYBR